MSPSRLTSGAYSAPGTTQAQRCSEPLPRDQSKEAEPEMPVTHYPRPGLSFWRSAASAPGAAVQLEQGQLFAVIDGASLHRSGLQLPNIGAFVTPSAHALLDRRQRHQCHPG